MNKIILTGRLTKNAELSYLPSVGTPKMAFSLAVERNYQKDKNNKKVDFINCEMLGKHTENLAQYVTKGKAILVEGELNIEQYEKDGEIYTERFWSRTKPKDRNYIEVKPIHASKFEKQRQMGLSKSKMIKKIRVDILGNRFYCNKEKFVKEVDIK